MSNTTNLNLFKHDNPSTNTDPFNIESALNGNWDKIDTYAGNTNTAITNSENSIEALQQENQRLKETLPTTTGTGETITLNKTAEMEFVVPPLPEGNTVQDGEPTPSVPVEVQVVKGDVEVLIQNKNLFNKDDVVLNKMVTGAGGLIDFTGVFSSNYIKVQPNTNYYVNEYIPTVVAFDKDKNALGYIRNAKNSAMIITPATCEYIKVRMFDNSINMTTALNNAMLNLGSTATSSTPHQEQLLPLTLGDIELCKIGDYKDYFYKSGSKWYLNQMVMKKTITSNSITQVDVAYSNIKYFRFFKSNNDISYNNYSEHQFYYSNAKYTNNGGSWDNSNLISKIANRADATVYWIGFPIGTTLEEAKEALNNSTLYYQLKEPIVTEITDTTLINQLEAIYNAISYYEQTNISGTSSSISPLFDVEAYQSTKLLLENALNRLELLES